MGYIGVIYPVEEPGERRLGVRIFQAIKAAMDAGNV
jgi:hypothetical protein